MSKASKDMDIARRQASAGQLLYQDKNSSVQGGVMNFGKTRDEDGTVDRVPDPPEALKPTLLAFKDKAIAEGIDLASIFQQYGGTRYGTISKRLFCTSLTTTFLRFNFTDQLLYSLVSAYGVGAEDTYNGGKELVAWCDFVEDVMGAAGSANADPNAATFGTGMNSGKTRDEDGTVDRVPDPPDHLKFFCWCCS